MSILAVIPARYASTRFPGKPLALLGGKSIVGRVWTALAGMDFIDEAIVATDDERILNHINQMAGYPAAMMTATTHHSGTDRCGEVLQRLEQQGEHYDIVINVQGDEPFVNEEQLRTLARCFKDYDTDIATLCTPIATAEELLSPNNVKVVRGNAGQALYFSRQPIPYRRGVDQEHWLEGMTYYKHVGIYAFRAETLKMVCQLPSAELEDCEKLEQLRWLSAGYRITVETTDHANIGIDTPEDLAAAERWLKQVQDRLQF